MSQQNEITDIKQPKPYLLIDTNAFIRCLDLHKLSEKYRIYTTDNVLSEIRDKRAKEKFLTITYDIETASVDQKSFNLVEEFSKKTGDFSTLSFTDKELIALGVLFMTNNGKQSLLRKEPPELTEWIPPKSKENNEEEDEKNSEENAEPEDEFVTVTKGTTMTVDQIQNKNNVVEIKQENNVGQTKNSAEEDIKKEDPLKKVVDDKVEDQEFEDDDDDKGWINPDNITKKLYNAVKKDDKIKEAGVAIMTTDFAMQNVIIQMGIPLISLEGFVIKQTRRFILECYACKKMCKNPEKQFCPACGNPTLSKLSVRVNDDGTMTFYRNPNKKFSNRGKIYSIPKKTPGRNPNDLILREDELLMAGRRHQQQKAEREKDFKFKQRLKDYENGMTFDDITLRYKQNNSKMEFGYGKTNPNDRYQFKKRG